MDVHIDIAITRGLRRRAIDVLTSQEDGTRRLADADLLTRCATLDRVIVTQDKDFLIEARRRQRIGVGCAGIVYAPARSTAIGQMIADLELLAAVLEPDQAVDRVFVLPLR